MCHHRPSPFCFFTSCPRGRVSSHQPARAPWAERLRASDARRRLVRGWGRDVGDGRRRRPRGQSLGEAQTPRRARPPTRRRQGLSSAARASATRPASRPAGAAATARLRLPTRRARPSRGQPRRAGQDPASSRVPRTIARVSNLRPTEARSPRRLTRRGTRPSRRGARPPRPPGSIPVELTGRDARGDCRGMPPGEDGVRRADAGRAGRASARTGADVGAVVRGKARDERCF